MNYKGAYDSGTSYSIGDVVVYDDGVAYELFGTAAAGTTPHEKRVWRRVDQPFQEVVMMFHSAFSAVPKNIDDEAITLKTDDGEYLITVDDSGDTPDLVVTAIEEEGES